MTNPLSAIDKLRLECEFLLIAGKRENALNVYDKMLLSHSDPFLLTAKAKLLESLREDSEAAKNFDGALKLAQNEEEREEILRLILELDESERGILKDIAYRSMLSRRRRLSDGESKSDDENQGAEQRPFDSDKTEIEPATWVERPMQDDSSLESGMTELISDRETLVASPKDVVQGQSWGRYKILDKLGEGGMGVVYKALDTDLGRTVAMKVILGASDRVNLQYAQRFLKEVKATAKLHHPNIIGIYDFGDHPQYFFTMEYVEGTTLSQKIREEIFKSKKAAQVLKEICEAIECAHKEKIIHRDLKPSNVMVGENCIKVMDFGLAKFMEGDSGLSRTGDILGTPSYMSPEQAMGREVDERSDIYSLGAIGYEMVTGRPVFKGESVFNIIHQVSHQEPLRPISLNANIDADMETIVLKCLEKAPEKRYQSARELREDLQRYLENRPISAKAATSLTRTIKWVKRKKELAFAIATMVFSVVAIFGYVFHQFLEQKEQIRSLGILSDLSRWNKEKIKYDEEEKNMPGESDDVPGRFEKALALYPSFMVYQQWGIFCFQYAHFHDKNRYYKIAEEKFNRAIALNPDDYISMYYVYMIHSSSGECEETIRYRKRWIDAVERVKPDNEFGYGVEAMKALEKKDIEGAARFLQKAVSYNGSMFCGFNMLGWVYLQKGDYVKAGECFGKSLSLAPNYRPALMNQGNWYVHQGTADPQRRQECFTKARDCFQKARRLASCKDVDENLLNVYRLLNEKENALELLEEIRRKH